MMFDGWSYNTLSWCSQGERLALLRREEVVPYQVGNGPYDRDHQKGYKACTVVDYLGKGKHDRYPPDHIVGDKDDSIGQALFDWSVVARVLPEPCEPHGGMLLDDHSVQHPDDHKPDKPCQV
jgi:hypothetical protein